MGRSDAAVRFHRSVTVLVGDNGSGKSTLLEAIAVHQGLNAEGGARGMQFQTKEDSVSPLHRHLRLLRSPKQPRDVFILRAKSYFNVATAIEQYGPKSLARYGGSPHARSHGESFVDLLVHRFRPNSLFLLDEPEAALSVHGQLQFLVRMHNLVAQGCQFVIATHPPLAMALPDAVISQFSDDGPAQVGVGQRRHGSDHRGLPRPSRRLPRRAPHPRPRRLSRGWPRHRRFSAANALRRYAPDAPFGANA